MKIVQLNQVCFASTGKIALGISRVLDANDIENYILYTTGGCDKENAIRYGSIIDTKFSALLAKVFGSYGFYSFYNTWCLFKELDRIKPDIIHIHNIHGHNVHLGKLFHYIKKHNIKVVWTFHDCWAFTGYCPHFVYEKCYKWEQVCKHCTQYRKFSKIFDRSQSLFLRKFTAIRGVKSLSVVTPSEWLAKLAKNSIFEHCPITVINNGIDLDLFKPTKSNFRQKYGLDGKKILLGVAIGFSDRKGFSFYIKLAKRIDPDTVIVMVGVSKAQIKTLPDNIIGIERTNNQKELAEIYTAANVFLNCTLAENFPTVNLEALACGTPVVTFNTGGSVESATDGVGAVVAQGDIKAMYQEAKRLMAIDKISEKCREAAVRKYDERERYIDYIELYKNI